MFNGDKLKELERRIGELEKAVDYRYCMLPGEDYARIKFELDERVSLFRAVKTILIHLGLEFKRTPETLQLVTTKKK